MNKSFLILPFAALMMLVLLGCEGSDSPSTGNESKPAVRLDTARLLADQISTSTRLYTTEYQIHKIVTHSDESRLRGNVFSLPVNVELTTGERKIAIPIDVTVKAYIDFSGFTANDIKISNGLLRLTLPDPQLAVTATRIDNGGVRQYVDLTRSTFKDNEVLALARQGTDSIVSHLDRSDLLQTSRLGARRALLPLLGRMGFSPDHVTITFRPELKPETLTLNIENSPYVKE